MISSKHKTFFKTDDGFYINLSHVLYGGKTYGGCLYLAVPSACPGYIPDEIKLSRKETERFYEFVKSNGFRRKNRSGILFWFYKEHKRFVNVHNIKRICHTYIFFDSCTLNFTRKEFDEFEIFLNRNKLI